MSDFTEEQQKQLKALNRSYAFKGLKIIAIAFISLVVANLLVVIADMLFVHNKFFVIVMSFLAGFSFSKLVLDNFRFLGENLKTETIKIIQDKE